jgi:hypothetical protein
MTLNLDILEDIQVSSQEYIILKSFDNFYQNLNIINKFLKILNGDIHKYNNDNNNNISRCAISIRLIDYFVTKYSKNHKVIYKINNTSHIINVYNSYKQQLKAYQKKHFDPFSRGYRIPYFLNDTCIITTISQLNFFKWFFSNGLYEYILEYHNDIENEMNINNNKIKIEKKPKLIKKKLKQNYCIQNTHSIHNNVNNIIVSFN